MTPRNPTMKTMQQFFYIRRDKKYEQVRFADIIYVKGKNGYIQIVTEQQTYLVMNTLTVIKKFLPDQLFCRIHHSYIVALMRVKAFDRTYVQLCEATEEKPFKLGLARISQLPVGFRYRGDLRKSVAIMRNKSGSHTSTVKRAKWDLELEEVE